MSTYYVSVSENLTAGTSPAVGVKSTLNDALTATSVFVGNVLPVMSVHATASVTMTYHYKAGVTVSEGAKANAGLSAGVKYSFSISESSSIGSTLNSARVIDVFESAHLASLLNTITSVTLSELATAHVVKSELAKYHLSMTDGAAAHDALLQYVGAIIHETSHIALSQGVKYIANVVMAEHTSIINYLYERMVFRVALSETSESDDILTPQMVYDGVLDDYIQVDEFLSPDDSVTVWAMNTRTNAVTEYRNWNFNSFASMGRKYIGANANGLFELNGSRDITTNIVADMAGGMTQMNGSKFTGLKGVYIGMNNQGEFFLRLNAGDERTYLYQFVTNPNLMTSKVRVGKGLRSRYFQWELISTGPDFDLDSIEFIPMVSDRRV